MKLIYWKILIILLVITYGNLPHYINYIPLFFLGFVLGHIFNELERYRK